MDDLIAMAIYQDRMRAADEKRHVAAWFHLKSETRRSERRSREQQLPTGRWRRQVES